MGLQLCFWESIQRPQPCLERVAPASPGVDDIGSCGRFGPRTLLFSSLIFIPPLMVFSTPPPPSRTKIIVSRAAPCGPLAVPAAAGATPVSPPRPPRSLFSSRGTQPETRLEAPSCSHPSPAGSPLFLAAFCTALKVKNSLSPAQDCSGIPHLPGYNGVKMPLSWRFTEPRAAPSRQWPGRDTAALRLWEEAGSKPCWSNLQPAPVRSSREGWRYAPCRGSAGRKIRNKTSGFAPTPLALQAPCER